ncbi:acyloxyacyl hydrolase [Luteimonas dalianensis]|uniref:acyloxyacyl hydrolase n=1 Tax=Luteimonas dalianensis TaxID=1148196 RepID=UPI003D6A2912
MHRFLLRTFLALAILSVVPLAQAQAQVEVAGGVSVTRDSETTGIASIAWMPEWRQAYGGTLRWELGAIYVPGRSGTHLDLDDDVGVFHGGLRYNRPNGFTAGFGAGVQVGETDALSGNPQFVSTVGWRWNRFSLLARHISNASIMQPNDGETMLLAAWRF